MAMGLHQFQVMLGSFQGLSRMIGLLGELVLPEGLGGGKASDIYLSIIVALVLEVLLN